MLQFCDPIENTSNQNLKNVFPLTEAYGIRIQQAQHANIKKCFYPHLVSSEPSSENMEM